MDGDASRGRESILVRSARFVNGQPNITAAPDRQEVLIPCLVESMKLHAGAGR